jgi:hypothetical protein
MTGRVLMILKEHAQWETVKDLHLLYQSLLNMGFDPDAMTTERLHRHATISCRINCLAQLLGTSGTYLERRWVANESQSQ